MSETDRKTWGASAHERKVENLYGGGVENYADRHDGYLNFGLWENGIADYVKAAENLVHRMGTILGLNETQQTAGCRARDGHAGHLSVQELRAAFD